MKLQPGAKMSPHFCTNSEAHQEPLAQTLKRTNSQNSNYRDSKDWFSVDAGRQARAG